LICSYKGLRQSIIQIATGIRQPNAIMISNQSHYPFISTYDPKEPNGSASDSGYHPEKQSGGQIFPVRLIELFA
jgi:hypothetical protein